jgi:hypothetical protein
LWPSPIFHNLKKARYIPYWHGSYEMTNISKRIGSLLIRARKEKEYGKKKRLY